MENPRQDVDEVAAPGVAAPVRPHESFELALQRRMKSLVHANQCVDVNCRLPSCTRMKRVVKHAKICRSRRTDNCAICKFLISLCCCHAKRCQDSKCAVPHCSRLKQSIRQVAAAKWAGRTAAPRAAAGCHR